MSGRIECWLRGSTDAWRVSIRLAVLVACALVGAELSAADAPPQIVRTDYYEIQGTNIKSLLASMQIGRPFTNNAFTEWHIDWNYEFLIRSNECCLRSFEARVQVRYTLPRWTGAACGSRSLQREWARYQDAVAQHEQGHVDIAASAAQEMIRTVRSKAWSAPSRKELKAQIDAACERILDDFRAREVAYDEKTDHGRTQGARLQETSPTNLPPERPRQPFTFIPNPINIHDNPQ